MIFSQPSIPSLEKENHSTDGVADTAILLTHGLSVAVCMGITLTLIKFILKLYQGTMFGDVVKTYPTILISDPLSLSASYHPPEL
jgi:hypothetical protein